MEERVYKVMKGAGAANIAVGVTTLIVGIEYEIGRASCRERV